MKKRHWNVLRYVNVLTIPSICIYICIRIENTNTSSLIGQVVPIFFSIHLTGIAILMAR